MKTYANGMKATEFSKKQIGVIYGKAKGGELKVEKWMMSYLYDLADFYGYDYSADVTRDEQQIKQIIEAVFAGNLKEAQEGLDHFTGTTFERLSLKRKNASVREFV